MLVALLAVALTSTIGQASVQAAENGGTVFVYRYERFGGKMLRPSVYCDDQEIAQIQSGRQFSIALKPGRHLFRSSDRQSVAVVEVSSGQTYYVRVDIAGGFPKGSGRVMLVGAGQGLAELSGLDPSDRDRIVAVDRISLHAVPRQQPFARGSLPPLPPPRQSQPAGPRGPKTLYVTYHSDPEGAMLYTNGNQAMGYTPVRLKYESPKGFRDGTECATLQPSQVRWVSGATASIGNLQACSVNGGQQSFSFGRPTGPKSDLFPNGEPPPGLQVDLQFAFQRELLARLDAHAEAQATRDAWARAAASVPPPPAVARPLSCTSLVIGHQIFTSCQ